MKNPTRVLLLFGLFWSAITLAFDVFTVRSLFGQWRSTHFVATDGRILSSEVTTNHGSDSTTYGAKVNYEYRVEGRRYASSRVRFGQMSDSGGAWARQAVRDNPAGATRTVYYDPAHPAEAVLQTGVGGQDLFLALFLSPFNAVMLGIWWMAVNSLRPAPPFGGATIRAEAGEIRVRFAQAAPLAVALGAFGLVTFLALFALAIPFGFSPPRGLTVFAWLMALIGAAWAFAWQRRKDRQFKPDLIVSPERGTLTRTRAPNLQTSTPKSWSEWKAARDTPITVPLERIRSVEIRERVSTDENATKHAVVVLVVGTSDGTNEDIDLATWHLPERAEAFAAWLRETLALR